MEKNEQVIEETKTGTRDLFLETLTKIGCQYEIDEEDDRILFAYQCEFLIVLYYQWYNNRFLMKQRISKN